MSDLMSQKSGRVSRLPSLDAADLAEHAPWKQPWWRAAPGDGPTLFWMILLHVGAVVGLILTPLPGWKIVGIAAALHFMGGLGTTVCFHRALAHKSVKLHPAVRNILTFFAMLNGSGSPLSWAANHRLHHAKSDTPEASPARASVASGGRTCAGSGRRAPRRSPSTARI